MMEEERRMRGRERMKKRKTSEAKDAIRTIKRLEEGYLTPRFIVRWKLLEVKCHDCDFIHTYM